MDVSEQVRQMALELEGKVIADRRYLHQYPELSLEEYNTQKFICEQLDEMGIPYKHMAATGVVATIKGEAPGAYDEDGNPAYRLGMRADIDALPIQERIEADYVSKYPGVAHTCGHDAHVAMLLGAARILNQMRDRLKGEIRLIFQPAEEVTKGAFEMIGYGVLAGVDSMFGMHIWSDLEAGKINCQAGQRMANTDWFRIDIEGASAHGSMPHKGVDAVVVAAELVVTLQVLVSRDISPFEPTVLTIGEIHGGSARNIVSGGAYMTGTVRTWTENMRKQMPDRISKIVERVAEGLGATAELRWEDGHCGLANDPACAARAEGAVRKLFGEEGLGAYDGTLAGEDFSEYLRHVPGVFAFLGTRNPEVGAVYPQHSCYFTIDESVLKNGVMFAAQYALDTLA